MDEGTEVVGCSLPKADLADRLNAWRALEPARVDGLRSKGGFRVRFRGEPSVYQWLRALAAAERSCCGWARWEVIDDGGYSVLEVMGPPDSSGTGPKRGGVGLYHLAWQLDTIDELVAARDVLLAAGAYTGESSHGATRSIYGADPDGNEFEIMWMLPRDAWGEYENAAPVHRLDLAGELRRWSGVRTAGSIVATGEEVRP